MATSDSTLDQSHNLLAHEVQPRIQRPWLRKDLTGQRFGRLVVLEMNWERTNKRTFAICRCDCGTTKSIDIVSLRQKSTESCGCLQAENAGIARRRDLIGQRFGKLLILEMLWPGKGNWELQRGTRVIARCDCGQTWQGRPTHLLTGATSSCGCEHRLTPERKRLSQRLAAHRRLALKRQRPYQFDEENVAFLYDYWGRRCAICGREDKGLWHILALDHWQPLSAPDSCGTVPWNILPLCHARKGFTSFLGEPCCNNSKSKKEPIAWLTQKLGPRKAKAKLREIDAYFAAARAFEEERQQSLILSA